VILVLGDVTPESGATVGGKAAQLADLSRAGFPVPRGIVVTAGAERIPVDQLLAALDRLAQRGAAFAVRSSAVVEDGVETSFAGQYLSLLNVARVDVSAAVEQVRTSGASERVAACGGPPEAIPVLIQPMVSAVAAGVAFTADPVTGDRTTTIVTAVHGLGNRLVSGEMNGEEWVVREGRATPRGVGDGVLDKATAGAIAALARRIADRSGNPQDIEWAFDGKRVHLLQARPMTGLSAIRSWDAPAPGYFSRNFRFGEWISAPVTPLFESWLLTRMEERLHELHRSWIGQVASRPLHVVVNGWYFYSLNFMPITLRAVGRSLPTILLRLLKSPRHVSGMIPPLARFGARMYEREWREDLLPRYIAAVERAEERVDKADTPELMALTDELASLAGDYFASIAVVAGYAYKAEGILVLCHRRHTRRASGGGHLPLGFHLPLLAGLSPIEPTPSHAVVSLDWWYPTANDDGCSRPRPDVMDATARHARLVADRQAAEASARAALATSPRRLKTFNRLLSEAQRAAVVREDQIRHFTRPWPAMRRALLRLGKALVRSGILPDAADVYFLRHDELVTSFSGATAVSLANRAAERRRARLEDARLAAPTGIGHASRLMNMLVSEGHAVSGNVARSAHVLVLGAAASPGQATGTVRVIHDPGNAAALQPGDILVAPLTAPAWTPLFAIAAAVVTDVGSPLAHASIIAREYGIPAVVGCGDATLRLKDGQHVTVDGSAGVVEEVI
jgi:pyruvate,water dikinase